MKFKHLDKVEVWNSSPSVAKAGRFIGYDPYSELQYVAHIEGFVGSSCWKHCRPARPNLKMDAKIYVRDAPHDEWKPACFAGWESDGRILALDFGKCSHTTEVGQVSPWNEYKVGEVDDE